MIEEAYRNYDSEEYPLYPRELLQEVLLGLHSMCRGAESKFFNGHTNITTSRFLVFGVKGLLQASRNVKNALLFNVLSYLSDKLLTKGNTAAGLDELYIWLSNLTAIEYIRNSLGWGPGADPAALRHPHPPVPVQRRQCGQEVLYGQPPAGAC